MQGRPFTTRSFKLYDNHKLRIVRRIVSCKGRLISSFKWTVTFGSQHRAGLASDGQTAARGAVAGSARTCCLHPASATHRQMNDAELAAAGKSIIMISSEMSELIGMSDRIMVMCDGRVTGFVNGNEATQENIMAEIIKSGKGE